MVSRTPDHTTDGPPGGLALALVSGPVDPSPVMRCTHIMELPPDYIVRRVAQDGGSVSITDERVCCFHKGDRVTIGVQRWTVVKAGRWGAWLVRVEGARQ